MDSRPGTPATAILAPCAAARTAAALRGCSGHAQPIHGRNADLGGGKQQDTRPNHHLAGQQGRRSDGSGTASTPTPLEDGNRRQHVTRTLVSTAVITTRSRRASQLVDDPVGGPRSEMEELRNTLSTGSCAVTLVADEAATFFLEVEHLAGPDAEPVAERLCIVTWPFSRQRLFIHSVRFLPVLSDT